MNNTRMKSKRQAKSRFYCIPSPEIIQNAPKLIESLPRAFRNVLDLFISLDNKYGVLYPTQQAVATISFGGSRVYTNKIIKQLCAWGFLSKVQRFNTSCIYKVSAYFRSPEIRNTLKKHLPSLSVMPMLLSLSIMSSRENVTLYKGRVFNNKRVAIKKGSSMAQPLAGGFTNVNKRKAVVDKRETTDRPTSGKEEKRVESTEERMRLQPERDRLEREKNRQVMENIKAQQEAKKARMEMEDLVDRARQWVEDKELEAKIRVELKRTDLRPFQRELMESRLKSLMKKRQSC